MDCDDIKNSEVGLNGRKIFHHTLKGRNTGILFFFYQVSQMLNFGTGIIIITMIIIAGIVIIMANNNNCYYYPTIMGNNNHSTNDYYYHYDL